MSQINMQKKYLDYFDQFKNLNRLDYKEFNDDFLIIKRDLILEYLSKVLVKYSELMCEFEKSNQYNTLKNQLSNEFKNYFNELFRLMCQYYDYDLIVKQTLNVIDKGTVDISSLKYNNEISQLLFISNRLFEDVNYDYVNNVVKTFIILDLKYKFI